MFSLSQQSSRFLDINAISVPCIAAAAKHHTQQPIYGGFYPNRSGRPERASCSNHNAPVIVTNRHNEGIIRICCQLSMLTAVKPLAAVPNGHYKVREARLQALQRHLGTRSDGDVAKAPCRIAVEMIQQMLAHLRPHKFLAMHDEPQHEIRSYRLNHPSRTDFWGQGSEVLLTWRTNFEPHLVEPPLHHGKPHPSVVKYLYTHLHRPRYRTHSIS